MRAATDECDSPLPAVPAVPPRRIGCPVEWVELWTIIHLAGGVDSWSAGLLAIMAGVRGLLKTLCSK